MRYLVLALLFVGCNNFTKQDMELNERAKMLFGKLPHSLVDKNKDALKIELGRKLYFEKRLSINNTISCNSCHKLDKFGVDNEITSPGHDGTRGNRNSPTVYNSALNFKQFWDGRAADLAEQAIGPILNPIEHGLASKEDALKKISTKEYLTLFEKAFPEEEKPFSYKNIGVAIGEFEKTLLTPSRFDDYLAGDINALNTQERRGLKKYVENGCTACHMGVGLGGSMFQKMGLVKKYPTKDLGRFEVTKKKRDKYKFKVPGLRNVTKTAPYLHDGSIASLNEVIEIMFEYQLDKKASKEDIMDIKAFLTSLEAKKLPKININ